MALNFQDVLRDVHNPTTHTLQTSSGGATIFAVVNTGAAGVGESIVTINPRTDYIGLVSVSGNVNVGLPTVVIGNETLYAVVNTAAVGVSNSIVTINPRTDYIGLMSVSGNINLGSGVNGIGFATVNVVDVIPGTGVLNLGKAVRGTPTITDVGVVGLAVRKSTDSHDGNVVDGQYGRLSTTDFMELKTRDQRAIDLANCNATIDYTALSNDTTGITFSSNHVFGTGAITFNKVNGSDNTVYGGVSKSLATINISEIFEAGGFVGLSAYIPSLTNVVNVFLRVGTDASNYNCWTWPVASLTAGIWMNLRQSAAVPDYTKNAGNGWNPSDLRYVAFGVEFNAESNTLDGMIFDHVHVVGGRVTATDVSTAVTSTVNTANVNINRVGGVATDSNNGTSGAGTLRVTVASDSTGQIKLASGVAGIGFATINVVNQPALVASSAYIGLATVVNGIAWPDPKTYIGLTSVLGTVGLAASTLNIGSVSILGGGVGLNAGVNGIGFATVNVSGIAAGVNKIGFATVNVAGIAAGTSFIGFATTVNTTSTANIGSVSVLGGGIGINAGVNNIGFATVTLSPAGNPSVFAVNVGTNKALVNLPIGFSAASTVTIAVPTNANTIKITNMLLNSDATVRFTMKSGVTYLTGNASIGVTLNPGGGFIMTGSPDSPSWIGLPSGALVIEKLDLTATAAKIAGNVVYWQE